MTMKLNLSVIASYIQSQGFGFSHNISRLYKSDRSFRRVSSCAFAKILSHYISSVSTKQGSKRCAYLKLCEILSKKMFCVMTVFVVQELHSTGICILSILNQFLDTRGTSVKNNRKNTYATTGKSLTSNARMHKFLRYGI